MKFKNFLFLIVLIKTEVVTDLSTTITFPSLSQNIERYEEIEARKRQAIEYIKLIEDLNLDEIYHAEFNHFLTIESTNEPATIEKYLPTNKYDVVSNNGPAVDCFVGKYFSVVAGSVVDSIVIYFFNYNKYCKYCNYNKYC